MQDYNKNAKPVVKVPATQSGFRLNDQNLAPIARPAASKSAFGDSVLPTNSVTSSSSAKLQKATRLPGRVSLENGNPPFAN